jgi:hypothetical protein
MRPYLEKTHHKKELVELLKLKTLISSPNTTNTHTHTKREERVKGSSASWHGSIDFFT